MIGVFGGTFDPPHLAHAVLADEARHALDLKTVLWVLTAQPPHKTEQPHSAVEHRLAMVASVMQADQHFELSRADLDREPPHYAVGTMAWLRERYPGERFTYLMGADSLRDLPTWHTPGAFVEACDRLAVMDRKGAVIDLDNLEAQIPGLKAKLTFVEAPVLEISGRDIRRRVRAGDAHRYFLLPEVAEYIQVNNLYR